MWRRIKITGFILDLLKKTSFVAAEQPVDGYIPDTAVYVW